MKIIGLTGGIASGKSTVLKMIQELKIPVMCADKIARDLPQKGSLVLTRIVQEFGDEILLEDKTLNREKLGSLVFSNQQKRNLLNKIIHPLVRQQMIEGIKKHKDQNHPVLVLDVPLLFEAGFDALCDETILVYAPEKVMRKRLKERDNLDDQEIKNRIASQMPIEEKKGKANHIIDNSGNLENTKKQVEKIFKN